MTRQRLFEGREKRTLLFVQVPSVVLNTSATLAYVQFLKGTQLSATNTLSCNFAYNFVIAYKLLDLLRSGKASLGNSSRRADICHCLVSTLHAVCGETVYLDFTLCFTVVLFQFLPFSSLSLTNASIQDILTT